MSLQSATALYSFAMKMGQSPLSGVCGLILILLPLTFRASSAACRSTSPCKIDRSIPRWDRIACDVFNSNLNKTDNNNPAVQKKVLLYSRASSRHVQVKKKKVDARDQQGSEYARLVLESDNFGRLKIRSENTNRYLCMNKKGKLVTRVKKQSSGDRCIFREEECSNGYFQFKSVKYPQWFIGFSKKGRPIIANKSAKRTKPLHRQFAKRPVTGRRRPKHPRRAIHQFTQLRKKIIRLVRMKLRL